MLVEQDRNPCVHALVPIGELREEATWTFPPQCPFYKTISSFLHFGAVRSTFIPSICCLQYAL